jgi:sodium/potassium/calcium exchanger 6
MELQCRLVHKAQDKCAFIRVNCQDEEAGLLSYLDLYYCNLPNAQPVAFIIIICWLGLLFSTIGIAASDFFCINLSTIATLLGLSENLAGVTFLAFGNGSPDVFSTFAAMSSNSGSLAVGELIGAAGFITAVVAGSMAFVQPFKVAKKSFVRDVSFFIVAASFSLGFLYDGKLYLWETATMVGLYIVYVILVVTWHWWMTRRRKIRRTEAAARSHYIIPGSGAEELGEQYHDDEEDRDTRDMASSRTNVAEDFVALEAPNFDEDEDEADEDARERFLGQINSNMRLSRPRQRERRSTHNPIRPSLVGALEFRSVLAGLRKSRNIQSYQLHPRRYSDDPTLGFSQDLTTTSSEPHLDTDGEITIQSSSRPRIGGRTASGNRARAVSAVEPGVSRPELIIPRIDLLGPLTDGDPVAAENLDTSMHGTRETLAPHSPTISISPPPSTDLSREHSPAPYLNPSPARLAPPGSASTKPATEPNHSVEAQASARPSSSQVKITRELDHSGGSTQGSTYTNEDLYASPTSSRSPSPLPPRRDSTRPHRIVDIGLEEHISRPTTWWPHSILPPPQVFFSTLFPTLSSWTEKSWWERCLAVVAAPSVFLLTITLPVVEIQRDDESDEGASHLNAPSTVPSEQPIRRRSQVAGSTNTLQNTSNCTDDDGEPQVPNQAFAKAIGAHGTSGTIRMPSEPDLPATAVSPGAVGTTSLADPNDYIADQPESDDWNRWLIIWQIFTAPFFIVLIVWANTHLDDPHWLLRPSLISLTVSLVLLAFILVTTNPDKPPKWHPMLCFLGFTVSISWISTIAGEVVGVLKALGVILNISDAILGLTIFAVGNSLGDLVADITVAKLGYPVMALSACFGGPMLNILLGIGVSGMYMTITGAQESHHKHPNKKMKFKPYVVEVDRTLVFSGVALLVTLVGLLIVVPLRKWRMDRVVGWGLILLWIVATVGNVGIEFWTGGSPQKDS